MRHIRMSVLAAALCIAALPATAVAGPPAAAAHPGSAHVPTQEQARALGRKACGEFKLNFADNRQQFGKCVAAVARARRTRITPRQACGDLGLSRKREADEKRSDFNACIVAAARGTHEGEEGVTGA